MSVYYIVYEDPVPSSEDQISNLERENDFLRKRIASLEQELFSRSPTKKAKSKKGTLPGRFDSFGYSFASGESDVENTISKLDRLKLDQNLKTSPATTPKGLGKRQRKLTTRQRDLGPEALFNELQ